ncbi:DMT family transporter [Bradyrhizobium diazoefficiens]|uniref:DMT family transporter n=1 Tax=Bradyrhizobium diazoefficiens TaxID=1355477 RepID=UPI0019098DD4|nr:DMT family transporter [Bradyrhizobium diazoefficiens]QQO14596.1 DMT family transporter [Bradyrhizobium diazoefficiens]
MTASCTLLLSLLMFAAGVGIPIMAAWNSRLGTELESPWAAAFILFVLGTVICGIAMLVLGLPKHGWFEATPLYYAGGLVVSFYILSITWTAPRIGVANAVFFVLLGQIVTAALVDQFGLFGALKSSLTTQRIIGIVFMLIGTYLARRIG